MKDIQKMRLSLLKQFKDIRRFFDAMEAGVKSRDPIKVQRAYIFVKSLVYHMDKGDLTPLSIELHHELLVQEEIHQQSERDKNA